MKAPFRRLGWDRATARRLTAWCTWQGGLPQGAPTSPRLSNLVNRRLDARLEGVARACHATYSRYADDLTFSWAEDRREDVRLLQALAKAVVGAEGYRLHVKKKVHLMRAHQRQVVTGLVANERAGLPREIRRWLRAVEHRLATTGQATLTEAQLDGWRALSHMVATQPTDADGRRTGGAR